MKMIVTTEARKKDAAVRQMANAASWLSLAAAPTFALMAWIAATNASRISICSLAPEMLPVDPMALMYLLMSIFHIAPWLKLFSGRLSAVQPPHNTN